MTDRQQLARLRQRGPLVELDRLKVQRNQLRCPLCQQWRPHLLIVDDGEDGGILTCERCLREAGDG